VPIAPDCQNANDRFSILSSGTQDPQPGQTVSVRITVLPGSFASGAFSTLAAMQALSACSRLRWRLREGQPAAAAGSGSAGIAFGAAIAWFWVDGLEAIMPGITFRFPFGTALIAAVLMGVLAAVLPARRAARLDPI
jgi:hypothetical protein